MESTDSRALPLVAGAGGILPLCAIAAAITGGRFGLFRPDLTLMGATDLLSLVDYRPLRGAPWFPKVP